jgi:hypothetical protein
VDAKPLEQLEESLRMNTQTISAGSDLQQLPPAIKQAIMSNPDVNRVVPVVFAISFRFNQKQEIPRLCRGTRKV